MNNGDRGDFRQLAESCLMVQRSPKWKNYPTWETGKASKFFTGEKY